MAKKIIWTVSAQQEREAILGYWIFHNKSNTYSIKLNYLFTEAITYLAVHPQTGRLSDIENIRTIRVRHYLIIYEETESVIYILSVWDARQNPEKLQRRLE